MVTHLGKKCNPIFKITRAKEDGDMAQVAECLPSEHEALSSNSNTTKKNPKNSTVKINIIINF
jgi:hypothetical protein